MPAERDLLIVGYSPSEAAGGIGALLLAEPADGGLRYVGRVGTGFSMAEMRSLRRAARGAAGQAGTVALPPEEKRKGIIWVRPAWSPRSSTPTGPRTACCATRVYKGLRARPGAGERRKPGEHGARARRRSPRKRYVTDADLAQIWVTNPDRVMFGQGGPSKLELALYYARVGDWMLPELIQRPVSLVRCPSGRRARTASSSATR